MKKDNAITFTWQRLLFGHAPEWRTESLVYIVNIFNGLGFLMAVNTLANKLRQPKRWHNAYLVGAIKPDFG
jgi:hypothetical protein